MRQDLLRFLEVVQRRLGAVDARIEFGGAPPEDACVVSAEGPDGWRLVARMTSPTDVNEATRSRLEALMGSFVDVAAQALDAAVPPGGRVERLDEILDVVRLSVGAAAAVVIDERSPVVWGASEALFKRVGVDDLVFMARFHERVSGMGLSLAELLQLDSRALQACLSPVAEPSVALQLARELPPLAKRIALDASELEGALVVARAVQEVRRSAESSPRRWASHSEQFGLLARRFSATYVLVLAFDAEFSELHAEGAAVRALPVIERLVSALPPLDPEPRAKVTRLRPR